MPLSRLLLAAGLTVAAGGAVAQPAQPMRIRGTIEAMDGNVLTVKPRSGPSVTVTLAADAAITGVSNAKLSDIKPGSYVGTAAVPQPDGTEKALEVHVFPPALAGSGEGHRPFDLGNSNMTNGTVGDLVVANGRTMTVKYNGGQKTIVVPDDVPVVLLDPGAPRSLIQPGAKVIVQPAKAADGTLTANRISVGENGITPPM